MITKLHERAAGIDLGSELFFVAVPGQPVRSFDTCTAGLLQARDYLQEHQVRTVAMEATGVYWVALHEVLEAVGLEVCVVNGAHARNVPGRKSDVQDCQWLQQLHAHGLLRPSFIPAESIRALRAYLRLREDHIRQGAMHVHLMQKALDLLNVKLHTVISQITGVSGLAVVEAILRGERDAKKLAELCDERILKTKRALVERSLRGNWKKEQLFALRQAHEGWTFCQNQVQGCDAQIAQALQELTKDMPPPPPDTTEGKPGRHHRIAVPGLHGQLLQLTGGVDASKLPGLTDSAVLKLIGEVGTDLSRWASEKHFTSWLGLAPRKHQSGKRSKRVWSQPKRPAAQIFRLAAQALAKSQYLSLGGFYRRLKARSSGPVAITATARKLAVLFYRAMRHGLAYVEEGLEAYEQRYRARQERFLQKRAAELGFTLTPAQSSLVH